MNPGSNLGIDVVLPVADDAFAIEAIGFLLAVPRHEMLGDLRKQCRIGAQEFYDRFSLLQMIFVHVFVLHQLDRKLGMALHCVAVSTKILPPLSCGLANESFVIQQQFGRLVEEPRILDELAANFLASWIAIEVVRDVRKIEVVKHAADDDVAAVTDDRNVRRVADHDRMQRVRRTVANEFGLFRSEVVQRFDRHLFEGTSNNGVFPPVKFTRAVNVGMQIQQTTNPVGTGFHVSTNTKVSSSAHAGSPSDGAVLLSALPKPTAATSNFSAIVEGNPQRINFSWC